MVNSELDLRSFLNRLNQLWPGAESTGYRSLFLPDQFVEVAANEEYDPSRIDDPTDGYQYYRYEVQISPRKLPASIERQVEVARSLKERLEEAGLSVVVVADFEHLL